MKLNEKINFVNMLDFKVLLYYKFVPIENPELFKKQQLALCQKLGIHGGRIIVTKEGINGTVEGTKSATDEYIKIMHSDERFSDVKFKISDSDGNGFPNIIDPKTGQPKPKLSIKVRDELVTTDIENIEEIGPITGKTGKYISAEQLHEWIHGDKEFYIVDMRNDYEYEVGHFDGSVLLNGFKNFRDLPKVLPQLDSLKGKTIVTVCTGGIRCEKASGVLLESGFNDVYQLKDGIVTYMEKYPNEDFLGKLYVFDQRQIMGFNTADKNHKIVGKCRVCHSQSENLVDYYNRNEKQEILPGRHYGIVCEDCINSKKVALDTEVINDKTLNLA